MTNSKIKPAQHVITRISKGSNLYQLYLFDLSGTQPKEIEVLTDILTTQKANLLGKQLGKERNIPFLKHLKKALTKDQYSQLNRIKRKAKKAKRQQWDKLQKNRYSNWLQNYSSERIAIAEAIRLMNCWIKSLGRIEQGYDLDFQGNLSKYRVYERGIERVWVETAYTIKDAWIQQNQEFLISGQKVRHEVTWNEGRSKGRWLYLHQFSLEGQEFSCYSYLPPIRLKSELAQDFPPFSGKSLTPSEIVEIEKKCGISTPDALIEMLGWKILGQKFW